MTLLENKLLTSVVFYFQYQFLTTGVNIINVNISFLKTDVNKHYTTSVIYENRCRIIRNIQKKEKTTKKTSILVKIDVVKYTTTSVLKKLMLNYVF